MLRADVEPALAELERRSSDGWRPSPFRWPLVSRSSWRRSPSMDGAVRPNRRCGAAAVRGRGPAWCGGTGESTGASLGRVGGSSLEPRLASASADPLARRPLLPDPARHSAAHDQHPAHPAGATIIITCRRDGLTHLGGNEGPGRQGYVRVVVLKTTILIPTSRQGMPRECSGATTTHSDGMNGRNLRSDILRRSP
jgi:hypothetical protein